MPCRGSPLHPHKRGGRGEPAGWKPESEEGEVMSADPTQPTEGTFALTQEERATLLRLLQQALGDTRVEAHHTHTPGYREEVLREETVIRGLLEKIRGPG